MKETILFSNVIGDITSQNEECSFNPNTISLLRNAVQNNQNLVFINAPGFENDNLYFKKIKVILHNKFYKTKITKAFHHKLIKLLAFFNNQRI